MLIKFVFCIICFTNYASLLAKLHPLSNEYINEINEKQLSWKAGRNFQPDEWHIFKTLSSGVVRDFNHKKYLKVNFHDPSQIVPESFDARKAWPVCVSVIGQIRDQSNCEAGWAFAAVEAMSDRICIHSGYGKEVFVSAEDVLTCGATVGCSAYDPYFAWRRWSSHGIVSGGLYNHTEQGCKSYFLPPCDGHQNNCLNVSNVPKCTNSCDDPSLNFDGELTFGQCAELRQFSEEKQIQIEIYNNGPVTATFDVYEDFANYKSGIYQRTSEIQVGSQAVKIIGWGVEDGIKYWNVVNSWGEKWGDKGFFKMLRGSNECGIESYVLSGLPDLTKF